MSEIQGGCDALILDSDGDGTAGLAGTFVCCACHTGGLDAQVNIWVARLDQVESWAAAVVDGVHSAVESLHEISGQNRASGGASCDVILALPHTIGFTCADAASVGGEDLLVSVVEYSVLSSTLTVLWQDAGVVDSGHTGWTLTASEWLHLAGLFGVGVLGPATGQRASVGHQAVESEWLSAFLWTKCGGSPHDSFASDGGTDLVVGGQDVAHGFLGLHLSGGVQGCTVGGAAADHVVVDVNVSVAAVESGLQWATGFGGVGLLVFGAS